MRFAAEAGQAGRRFQSLSLDLSFRSTPPVLAVVDRLLAHLGADALGLPEDAPAHRAAKSGPGRVMLWPPVSIALEKAADGDAPGDEGWLDDATRLFADRLARQVKAWIDAAPWMASRGRPLRPEDVMVLVRKRGDLASLITPNWLGLTGFVVTVSVADWLSGGVASYPEEAMCAVPPGDGRSNRRDRSSHRCSGRRATSRESPPILARRRIPEIKQVTERIFFIIYWEKVRLK